MLIDFTCVIRYGYSKERFVWSLIYAVGIFCLGSGATIVHGVQNLWTSQVTYYLIGLWHLLFVDIDHYLSLIQYVCFSATWKHILCSFGDGGSFIIEGDTESSDTI